MSRRSFRGGNENPTVPEGERILTITNVDDMTSKKTGADMTKVVFTDMDTGIEMDHYVVFIEEGKQGHGIPKKWLKVLTGECDGDLEYDSRDWLGKRIKGNVTHETTPWENKHGTIIDFVNARLDISNYELYELEGETVSTKKENVPDEDGDIPF